MPEIRRFANSEVYRRDSGFSIKDCRLPFEEWSGPCYTHQNKMSPLKTIAESKPPVKTALEHDALVNKIRSVTGCGRELAEDYAKAIERKREIEAG